MTSLFGAYAAEWSLVLQAAAIATMFWGNVAALTQKSLKRMLGYSAIAQAGYLAIGLAAWGPTGRMAVLFFVVAYIAMNAAAFGLILLVDRGGRFDESVDGLRGLARRAPAAAASILVVLLSLTGIPPTAGFMGKYFLFTAAVEKGMVLLAVAGALNSVISLFYYFRIGKAMFLEEAVGASPEAGPLEPGESLPFGHGRPGHLGRGPSPSRAPARPFDGSRPSGPCSAAESFPRPGRVLRGRGRALRPPADLL